LSFEEGNTYDVNEAFGLCPSKCYEKPLLGQSLSSRDILQVISTISGMEVTRDIESPQYKAACWLIYDDLRKLNATDVNLVQRYILMLIFYATNGDDWTKILDFHSPSDECD